MRYTNVWNDLTRKIGYWVDTNNPYVTFDAKYIESVWWLLAELYNKNLLYKGYTIQPFSPMAGTGLSSHELNQPGCYRNVTDTTIVAQFKLCDRLGYDYPVYLLAWTTTPWTLPSNTALAVNPAYEYAIVKTINQYTEQSMIAVLATKLVSNHFERNGKSIPYQLLTTISGQDLVGLRYEQLMPYAQPYQNAGKCIQSYCC